MDVKDAGLKLTLALPNGAASTANTTAIDTGKSTALGRQLAEAEFLITAPALTTTEQPDGKTTIYDAIMSDNADLSSPTTLYTALITQTGAGSAGSAATTKRFRLPSDAKRYIGLKATGSTTGNNSAKSATLEVVF